MSSSVPVGALVGWMLLLTLKHVIADFMLQTSWMAIGKDQKTGWALPLLAHCLVHLAVSLVFIFIVAPRFWFVAFIDFAIHITSGIHLVAVAPAGRGAHCLLGCGEDCRWRTGRGAW